mmetsp:Transcript_31728/g.35144  ORF Transcript_31728/g.35144 Transcript_31728/m.35144 type:complete len:98 (-) Transcript_31728:22-315(-)
MEVMLLQFSVTDVFRFSHDSSENKKKKQNSDSIEKGIFGEIGTVFLRTVVNDVTELRMFDLTEKLDQIQNEAHELRYKNEGQVNDSAELLQAAKDKA